MAPRFGSFALTFVCAASLLATAIPPALAEAAPSAAATDETAGGEQQRKLALEAARELVASVALYPDPILGAVLEAATTPLDVVEAERFLAKREKDPSLQPDADWSPAIVALLNHPDLLRRMSEDLDWTRTLGAAVVEDLPVVQEAIQDIRRGALALRLLADTEFQRIVQEEGVIAIEPVDPELVRLPVYDAEQLLAALPKAPAGEPALAAAPAAAAAAEPAALPASEPEPPLPRPKPEPPPALVEPAPPLPAYVPPAASYAPPAVHEPYPAVPAAPPPTVSYAEPQRSFWSDAAIFAGGAALGGVLGYILADRDDDKKVVKKYYYYGDRRRPPGWWDDRIDWRDRRPGARVIKADKIVIKDSNVVVTGNDIVVRELRDRRGELVRIARPGDLPPERWHDWQRERRRERAERIAITRRPEGEERPTITVLPARETGRGEVKEERRREEGQRISVLPPREQRAEERAQRRAERREERREQRHRAETTRTGPLVPALPPPSGAGTDPSGGERKAVRAGEEQRRLERLRAREEAAAAERQAREQRRQEQLRAQEAQRLRAEAQAREERRRAIEQQRLERARAAELARAQEMQRRQAEEQARLLRRQQREAQQLGHRRERASEGGRRIEQRGGGQGQEGKKKRLWEEG